MWSRGFLVLTLAERWQPQQLVVHEEWQATQETRELSCASCFESAGTAPQVVLSLSRVLARAAFGLKRGLPGVTESATCGTSQLIGLPVAGSFCTTTEFWKSLPSRVTKR